MSKDIAESTGSANPGIQLIQAWPSQAHVDALVTLFPISMAPKDELNEELLEYGGDDLLQAILENVTDPKPGDVFVVPGFDLAATHLFVGMIPNWRTEFDRQDKTLLDICRGAIAHAKGMEIKTLGFPLLTGGGKFGYPKKRAVRLIVQAIQDSLDDALEAVHIIDHDVENLALFKQRLDIL